MTSGTTLHETAKAHTSGSSENTDRLLAAAVEVFAEAGYDGARVAEIARRADLTTGAIYSRYTGKAELLVDALDLVMADHLEAVFSNPETSSPTGVLSLLGSHLLEEEDGPTSSLFLEAVVAARRNAEVADMIVRKLDDERMRVSEIIDEAKAMGLFDAALDTRAVLAFIQAIGLGFTIFRTLGTPLPDRDGWQEVIDRVIEAAMPRPTPEA